MVALCLQKIPSLCPRFWICVSCREASVWSRSCRLQGLLRNIGTCFSPFAMLLQWVEIELLAAVGWKWGCQPFSCPCSQNVTQAQGFFSTFLSKESLPFVKSKCPLLTRSLRFPRAAARFACSAVWLHHAHPFVAAAEKSPSHAEKRGRTC